MVLTSPAVSISMIGLPASGKSTILAALWSQLIHSDPTSLIRLSNLNADGEYLTRISEDWLQCRELERTPTSEEFDIRINAIDSRSGKGIELLLPDVSGEMFVDQYANRICSASYVSSMSNCSGVMLLVDADKPLEGLTFVDIGDIEDEVGIGAPETTEAVDWDPARIPEQVALVELLQFLQSPPFTKQQRRLAVLISKWDVVDQRSTPKQWLNNHRPLFSQYLDSNSSEFSVEFFGVSAQGGTINRDDIDDMLSIQPNERVSVVREKDRTHDLSLIIQWLISDSL